MLAGACTGVRVWVCVCSKGRAAVPAVRSTEAKEARNIVLKRAPVAVLGTAWQLRAASTPPHRATC